MKTKFSLGRLLNVLWMSERHLRNVLLLLDIIVSLFYVLCLQGWVGCLPMDNSP